MTEYSEPKFISSEEQLSMQNDKNKAIAFCQCPLPILIEIDGVLGGYCHVVKYEKEYICKKCGKAFSVGRHFKIG